MREDEHREDTLLIETQQTAKHKRSELIRKGEVHLGNENHK